MRTNSMDRRRPSPQPPSGVNLASASSGAVATASTTIAGVTPSNANNGDHVGTGSWWADDTSNAYPDWVQVEFAGAKTIHEIDVFGLQQNYSSPVEPTLTMTSTYALTDFEVQYWNGNDWAIVPGGSVTGNDKVWRKFTFAPLITTKIRVRVTHVAGDNHSQMVEIEAYGPANVASAANGGVATASTTIAGVTPSNANNGDHVGTGSWWADDTSNAYPDWIQVEFAGSKTISEIDVFGLQQNYSNPVEPTLTMTSSYALTNFEVQYWNGSDWATVPGGSVTGNDKVWRQFTFAPLTTSKIRVHVGNVAGDNHSQVVEIEAYTASNNAIIQWLVTDHLGTPRMIIDQTGNLANIKRHDYLPFGEELFAPSGGRTTALGYSSGDGLRQQFTAQERDIETELDYFGARYYANVQGRFTGVDPYDINFERQNTADPEEAKALFRNYISEAQHWNRYAYALNNPLKYVDPDGREEFETHEATLLGQTLTITISKDIGEDDRADILNRIKSAVEKINSGLHLNPETGKKILDDGELKIIKGMKGIRVVTNERTNGMDGEIFQIKQSRVQFSNVDQLATDMIHDPYHREQWRYNCDNALRMEKEASEFTVTVATKLGLDPKAIETYARDALWGHVGRTA